ncbi:MAG: GNAT family N-acetyltransferase [Proteobacteria bacterium]|nr:GNAT family N-acetyltransferase [Pseudomonadota bacterium]
MVDTRFMLRRATAVDAPALWALRIDAIRRTCRGHYPDALIERWAASPMPDSFSSHLEREHAVVGVTGTRIAGFAVLNPVNTEVEAVFVAPDHGRHGLGRRLMAELEAAASRMGLRKLHLDASLNAVPFYTAAGYHALGQDTYTTSTGLAIACVRMEKPLA